jgi:hypothetical protein
MSQTHETCVDLTLSLAQMGFGTSEQVKQFTEFLNKYVLIQDKAKALNMVKLMRAMAVKYKDDAITAERASETLVAAKKELESQIGMTLTGEEFFFTVLATTRNNGLMANLSQMFSIDKKNIFTSQHRRWAENLQKLNPHLLANNYARELSQDGALTERIVAMRDEHPDVMRSGQLLAPVKTNTRELTTVDESLVHALYATWEDVSVLLKPVATANTQGYQPVSADKMMQAIEAGLKKAEDEGRLVFGSDVDKKIISELTRGHFTQINKKFLLYRKLGIDVEFNPLYILPNMHNKSWLYGQRLLELIEEERQGGEVTDVIYKRAYERAVDEQANRLAQHANYEAVFGTERWKRLEQELNFANNQVREKAQQEIMSVFRGNARTLYDSMHLTDDVDQLDQVGNAALMKLSSPAQALMQRSYYFRDAEAQLSYIKETDPYMGQADGTYLTKRLSNTTAVSQDLAILSLFGSNPALSMRKFFALTENAPNTERSKQVFDMLSGQADGHHYESIKQQLFPKDLSPVLDINQEARKTFTSLVRQARTAPSVKQYLAKLSGSDASGTALDTLLNPTVFEHTPLGALVGLYPAMIRPMLHLNTLIMDSTMQMLNLAEVRTGSLMAFEAVPDTFALMKTIISANLRGIAGADEAKQIRYMVARTVGVKESELTSDVLNYALRNLGMVKDALMLEDRKHLHQQSEAKTHKLLHALNGFNQSRLASVLAGGDNSMAMFAVKMAGKYQANLLVKELLPQIKAGKKLTTQAQAYVTKYGLTPEAINTLEVFHGDFYSGDGLMETSRLTAPISEERVIQNKDKLPMALVDKAKMIEHLRTDTAFSTFKATTTLRLRNAYESLKLASSNYKADKKLVRNEEEEPKLLSRANAQEAKAYRAYKEEYLKQARKTLREHQKELTYQTKLLARMEAVNTKLPTAEKVFEAFNLQKKEYRAFIDTLSTAQSWLDDTQNELYVALKQANKSMMQATTKEAASELKRIKGMVAGIDTAIQRYDDVAQMHAKLIKDSQEPSIIADDIEALSKALAEQRSLARAIASTEDVAQALEQTKVLQKLIRTTHKQFKKMDKTLEANTVKLLQRYNKRYDEEMLQEQRDVVNTIKQWVVDAERDRDLPLNEETAYRLGVFFSNEEILPPLAYQSMLDKTKQAGRVEATQERAKETLQAVQKAAGQIAYYKEALTYDYDTWYESVYKAKFPDEESFRLSKQSELNQLMGSLVENDAHALMGLVDELRDDAGFIQNDAGELSQLLGSSSVKGKVLNALFFHLKRFMLSAIHTDLRKYRTEYQAKGVAGVVGRATTQMMVYGSVGMLYQTLQGLISNQATGLLGVYEDINNEDLEPVDKLARLAGHTTKAVFYGMPLGVVASTVSYGLAMDKGVVGTLADLLMAPALSTLVKDAELGLDVGKVFSDDDEKRNKYTYELINQAMRNLPVANLMLPKAILNYGAMPWLRESLELESAGEAYRQKLLRSIENEDIGLDTMLPVSPLVSEDE